MSNSVTKKSLEKLVKHIREKHNLAIALEIRSYTKYRYALVNTCFSTSITVGMTNNQMNCYLHGMLAILENNPRIKKVK